MSYQWRGRTGRVSMALRGGAAIVLVAAFSALAVVSGGGGFLTPTTTVTSFVPASAGPVNAKSPVQYRGVVVGKLTEIDADAEGAQLTLNIDEEQLRHIPAGVQTRLLPRTLFGDQYVELAEPRQGTTRAAGSGKLASGAVIPTDTSQGTVQMYETYTRLHSLLATFRPAEFQVALTTIADVLRGRGDEIGRTIDTVHRLSGRFRPEELDVQLSEVADISERLAASAPDAFAALDDAVAMSRLVVEEKQGITALLSSGTELVGSSQQLMNTHAQRAIEVIHMFEPVSDALATHPGQTTATLESLEEFARKANRTFQDDRFQIRAPVTFDDPYPYTPQDCPRYPGLDGPHCAQAAASQEPQFGGTAGPVGSEQERQALVEMAPSALRPQVVEPDPNMLGILFGPIARGTQVVVP